LIALLQLVLITTPVSEKIYLWLSVTEPARKADAIVVLGGNQIRDLIAARLYRRRLAPIVVVSNAPGAAEWMRANVVTAGVPWDAVLLDRNSYTTGDHPHGIAQLPQIDPKQTDLLIVTDFHHARRVEAVFRKAGFEHFTVYAGRNPLVGVGDRPWRWRIRTLPLLAYECTALLKYWWEGKIDNPFEASSPHFDEPKPDAPQVPAVAQPQPPPDRSSLRPQPNRDSIMYAPGRTNYIRANLLPSYS
jgi:uncharacterized SAM-binding protein YcdF (DUF218 family)